MWQIMMNGEFIIGTKINFCGNWDLLLVNKLIEEGARKINNDVFYEDVNWMNG